MNRLNGFFVVIAFLVVSKCYSQDYFLADSNTLKTKIARLIESALHEDLIKKNPVVVVNDKVLKKRDLNQFEFYASEIIDIEIIEKDLPEMKSKYGEQGLNGVVIIKTVLLDKLPEINISSDNVLFLINDKIYTRAEWYTINPDNVESITVIKDQKKMRKYTSDMSYDAVVLVVLRNN